VPDVAAPRYRWVVLAAGCLGTLVTGALRQGMPALGPALRDAFALSLGQVGLVFGALTLGMTLALVPLGALADRVGERPVLAGGLVATAAALGLSALAGSFALLVAGLFLTGLAGASAVGASGRAVMGWFGRRERGLALGIRQTAIPLGGALAALALPPVALAAGLDAALAVLAGAALVAALAGAVWVREPPPPPTGRPVVHAPPPLRDLRVWRLGIGSGLLVVAQAAIISFLVLFLHDARGLSLGLAAAGLAAVQVGGAVGRIAVGRWSDVRERRIAPMRVTGLAGAVLLALAAALSTAPGALLYPVLLAAGIAISSWNGLAFTAAAELAGRERAGTAMGLQNTLVSLLGAAAAPLFGLLVDLTSWGAAYLLVAAAPLAGWVVLRPLVPEEERRAAARVARLRRAAAGAATP